MDIGDIDCKIIGKITIYFTNVFVYRVDGDKKGGYYLIYGERLI